MYACCVGVWSGSGMTLQNSYIRTPHVEGTSEDPNLLLIVAIYDSVIRYEY